MGLVILFEDSTAPGPLVDVRLGYVLAKSAWGKGLASEMVGGLVRWCRASDMICSMTGGVASEDPASGKVLVNNGFERLSVGHEGAGPEQTYVLRL